MRFTVQKLQHDLVDYLKGAKPAPFTVRVTDEGKVHAVYTVSTHDSLAYAELTVRFLPVIGVTASVKQWTLTNPEVGDLLLREVTLIKEHVIRSMARHEVIPGVPPHPVGRALTAAADWVGDLVG